MVFGMQFRITIEVEVETKKDLLAMSKKKPFAHFRQKRMESAIRRVLKQQGISVTSWYYVNTSWATKSIIEKEKKGFELAGMKDDIDDIRAIVEFLPKHLLTPQARVTRIFSRELLNISERLEKHLTNDLREWNSLKCQRTN